MKPSLRYLALALGIAGSGIFLPNAVAAAASELSVWTADRGDGTYKNPVLFADYSDPDAVRVGDDFYLVSSSFSHVPGLPILHSRDLVNWTLINHALPALNYAGVPPDRFATPRPGEGVWAPSIRHHAGKFWIFFPDPDFGIYMVNATDPAGTWSAPVLVKGGKGLIDPCPLWADDGHVYLVHGWARSRSGKNNLLTLNELSADAAQVIDGDGTVIIDENTAGRGWTTLEGPKLYQYRGYYWVFAPVGGVTGGAQAVYRAENIRGPYEARLVLEQGRSPINGPHQGAWVDTAKGEHWFLHFQDRGAYGRVVHLEPMTWHDDDWPVIGADPDGDGKGEPVLSYRKPDVSAQVVATPATSDEFDSPTLSLAWQWEANPSPAWASLTAKRGVLRLASVPAPAEPAGAGRSLWLAPNLLMQKFSAPAFTVTTALDFAPAAEGESAGLIVFGYDYAWLGLRRTAAGLRLAYIVCKDANNKGAEREIAGVDVSDGVVSLRVMVNADAECRFAYSLDGGTFIPLGPAFTAKVSRWVGAKVGLFAIAAPGAAKTGHADFDWFRFTP